MHELAVIPPMVNLVNRYAADHGASRVVAVRVVAGELRDFEEEWVSRYFEKFARGTLCEGAAIHLTKTPILMRCAACGAVSPVTKRQFLRENELPCPACGKNDTVIHGGRELTIEGIEVI